MRQLWTYCLILISVAALFPATARASSLGKDVDKALAMLPKAATSAVRIVRLGDAGEAGSVPSVVLDRRGSSPMIPASNLKVVTTAAASAGLGDDYRFETRLYLRRDEDSGTTDVLVVGGGDPSFGDSALDDDVRRVLDSWAKFLAESGVETVGQLLVDDGLFDDTYDHPNWPENQKHLWYEAQVGALNFNLNCVGLSLTRSGSVMDLQLTPDTDYVDVEGRVKVGKKNAVVATRRLGTNEVVVGGETNAREQGPIRVTVDDPTAYFATVFAEALVDAGVAVSQVARLPRAPLDDWQLTAVHETPMSVVLARTNEDSINLYAEAFIKLLGHRATGKPGSWQNGGDAVLAYLRSLGVDTTGLFLDDGSGMSRLNQMTAEALTAALADRHASPGHGAYRTALSDAGSDGTLRSRFRDRPSLHGRVWGKTGYIRGVSTMSGLLQTEDGDWYAISVLVNDCPRADIWRAKAAQEAVFAAVDKHSP
ncbi:MAG: D-alanyl-D-alanine carboxypeptidase/D-alanyl-D-alanine-endopeptidase [Planctomycetota bacterium]